MAQFISTVIDSVYYRISFQLAVRLAAASSAFCICCVKVWTTMLLIPDLRFNVTIYRIKQNKIGFYQRNWLFIPNLVEHLYTKAQSNSLISTCVMYTCTFPLNEQSLSKWDTYPCYATTFISPSCLYPPASSLFTSTHKQTGVFPNEQQFNYFNNWRKQKTWNAQHQTSRVQQRSVEESDVVIKQPAASRLSIKNPKLECLCEQGC